MENFDIKDINKLIDDLIEIEYDDNKTGFNNNLKGFALQEERSGVVMNKKNSLSKKKEKTIHNKNLINNESNKSKINDFVDETLKNSKRDNLKDELMEIDKEKIFDENKTKSYDEIIEKIKKEIDKVKSKKTSSKKNKTIKPDDINLNIDKINEEEDFFLFNDKRIKTERELKRIIKEEKNNLKEIKKKLDKINKVKELKEDIKELKNKKKEIEKAIKQLKVEIKKLNKTIINKKEIIIKQKEIQLKEEKLRKEFLLLNHLKKRLFELKRIFEERKYDKFIRENILDNKEYKELDYELDKKHKNKDDLIDSKLEEIQDLISNKKYDKAENIIKYLETKINSNKDKNLWIKLTELKINLNLAKLNNEK